MTRWRRAEGTLLQARLCRAHQRSAAPRHHAQTRVSMRSMRLSMPSFWSWLSPGDALSPLDSAWSWRCTIRRGIRNASWAQCRSKGSATLLRALQTCAETIDGVLCAASSTRSFSTWARWTPESSVAFVECQMANEILETQELLFDLVSRAIISGAMRSKTALQSQLVRNLRRTDATSAPPPPRHPLPPPPLPPRIVPFRKEGLLPTRLHELLADKKDEPMGGGPAPKNNSSRGAPSRSSSSTVCAFLPGTRTLRLTRADSASSSQPPPRRLRWTAATTTQ
jgi:hypothetical protein